MTAKANLNGEPIYFNPNANERRSILTDEIIELPKYYIVKKDGDMWCAHCSDFENLQESKSEFGKTPEEALHKFITATQI